MFRFGRLATKKILKAADSCGTAVRSPLSGSVTSVVCGHKGTVFYLLCYFVIIKQERGNYTRLGRLGFSSEENIQRVGFLYDW